MPTRLKPNPVYNAFRYGMDYSGLKRDAQLPAARQKAPGTPTQDRKQVLEARIAYLGY
jgi:hypothetical protein